MKTDKALNELNSDPVEEKVSQICSAWSLGNGKFELLVMCEDGVVRSVICTQNKNFLKPAKMSCGEG